MIELELLQMLQAGGDLGIWVLVLAFWRQDRRILAVELLLGNIKNWANFGPHFPERTQNNGNKSTVFNGVSDNHK